MFISIIGFAINEHTMKCASSGRDWDLLAVRLIIKMNLGINSIAQVPYIMLVICCIS